MGQSLEKVYELEEAIREGEESLPKLRRLLKAGVSVNSKVGAIAPSSALYYAIEQNNTLAAELLLDRGADINKGYFTETPLHCAASQGNVRIACKLLEKGAKVNVKNHNDCTPLWVAVSKERYEIVHLLLQQAHVDVDYPCGDTFLKRECRSSPLCLAVRQNHVQISQELLEKGADVNFSDINGHTPLHNACSAGNQELVRLLMRHGCSLDRVDRKGYTPLHYAVNTGFLSTVKILLAAGCDTNIPCSALANYTALHLAAYRGDTDIAVALCSVDSVQIDARNRRSETPLAVVCIHGNQQAQTLLFMQEVNLTSKRKVQVNLEIRSGRNNNNHSFSHSALSAGQNKHVDQNMTSEYPAAEPAKEDSPADSVIKTKELPSCSRDQSNELNSSADLLRSMFCTLFPEVQTPQLDILHLLIGRGADLSAETQCGQTPIIHALRQQCLQFVLILMCHGAALDTRFLSSYKYSDQALKYQLVYPVVLTLAWSSARHHRFFKACLLEQPSHKLATKLPPSLKEVLEQPLSLMRLCRSVVRDIFTKKTSGSIAPLVDHLNLPQSVKCFLLLSDVLQTLRAGW